MVFKENLIKLTTASASVKTNYYFETNLLTDFVEAQFSGNKANG